MLTINDKLTRIYLIVAVSVVACISLISLLYFYHHVRTSAHENLNTQTVALAGNLESAVAFGDAAFAEQTLKALQHYPDVRMAAVVTADGKTFASYKADLDADISTLQQQDEFMTLMMHGVVQDISLPNSAPARLIVVASLAQHNRDMALTMGASMVISGLILFAAFIMFRRMSRLVTRPLQDLTKLMRTIEREGGHGQRARIISSDEIGELAKGFNAMLFSLEGQHIALNEELEERKKIEIEIVAARNQLQATLDAIPDLMFEVGLDGRYYDCRSLSTDLLAAPPEILLSSTISDVLPANAASVCLMALQEANKNGQSRGRQYSLPLPQGNLWFELSVARKTAMAGQEQRFIVLSRDITERKKVEDEVMNLAFYDPLTQLPNRRLLRDRLEQAMAASRRNEKFGALLFIDLDNFKTLNDTRGHDTGDQLLVQAAQRLTACVRKTDTTARLGGDEFVVILEDLSRDMADAAIQIQAVGEKILAVLNQPYQFGNYTHNSTASIGVTLFANHQESIDDLLKWADLAMYQSKAAGRNTLRFFGPEMQSVVTNRAAIDADLHEAMANRQFLLYYQPQVVGKGRLTGVEALIRWKHPQRGLVPPVDFVPIAEDSGLILSLGHWVMETACTQLVAWASRPEMSNLTIAVNVSARQFHQRDFVGQVLSLLDRSGANPKRLKLELTESMLVDNIDDVITKMNALKEKGVSFSLDDFGTGYSSLSYLKRLPLDQLKIDQGFVRNILTDANDAAIAKMVVALAESMGLAVIAEGVEIEAQRDFLENQGCLAYQGYLFGRPLPLEGFEELVKRGSQIVCDRSGDLS